MTYKKTLENLSYTDEIIVIDSFREDIIAEIVKSFSVKTNSTRFKIFKINAISQSKWQAIIGLFIDSKEWIDYNLKQEILEKVKT